MLPSFSLPQAYIRIQCRLACLVLCLVLRQPSVSGIVIDATGFLLLTPPSLRGNLSSNNILQNAERLHTGQISVPHSSVVIGDDVFTATSSGLIVNVAPCRPVIVANLRPRGCRTLQACGHLISIRRSPANMLLVLDAYRGLFEVHPVTGVILKLFDSRAFVNGRPCVFLNDFVIMKDGTIVLSDSSSRFDYAHEFWIRFEGRADGRLIGFSRANGHSKEILSGLAYPTGLEISSNGQALLVSENSRARILRLDLRKDKFFQRSYVNINLPGMPEHIRRTDRGTYWVGLSYPRFRGEPSPLDQYSSKAASRNFLAARNSMPEIRQMFKNRGLAVELDETGRILRGIHDPSGLKVGEVLEVTECIGVLYVGTRSQQATVRVVGAPSELNVDSLVQVLRGRCKVADDKIQATKESIEQQLQGTFAQKPQDSTATIQNYTPAPSHPSGSDAKSSHIETPQRVVNLQSLSRGLSKLHKALFNATISNKKVIHAVQPPGNVYQQKEKPLTPPTEQIIPIQQPPLVRDNLQAGVILQSPSTQASINESQTPQFSSAPQRIEGRLSVQFSHNSVGPPTVSSAPNVIHFQEALLRNQDVIKQQPPETSIAYPSGPQQGVHNEKPQEALVRDFPGQQQGTYNQKPQDISIGYSSGSQQGNYSQKPQESHVRDSSGQQQGTYSQTPQDTSTGYSSGSQQGNYSQKPQESHVRDSLGQQQGTYSQKPQDTSIGYPSGPQHGNYSQKPQDTSIGYSSGSQQGNYSQKPQDTFIGYPSGPQQGNYSQKPQDTSIGYESEPQKGNYSQKPQDTSIGYSSGSQQGNYSQKPQDTFIGYPSGPQQGNYSQKSQDTSIGYESEPQKGNYSQKPQETLPRDMSGQQQDTYSQKPQETSIGYRSGPQQDSYNQKPQDTSIGYSSGPQQGKYNQKPQETSIGYRSGPQQDTYNQKPQDTSIGYRSGPQQGNYNQKPQDTSIGYSTGPRQNVSGQKPQEALAGYPSQQQGFDNEKPQGTSIGSQSKPQQSTYGRKLQDMFVLGPQQGSLNQKPQETYMGHPSGPQQDVHRQSPQETFLGYPSVPQQGDVSYTETSNDPVYLPVKQPSEDILLANTTRTPSFHQMEVQQHGGFISESAVQPVTQTPPQVTTLAGGFMGFIGSSDSQHDASNNGYYTFQQNFGAISDPGLFGQIEPGINMNPGLPQRKHQFLPGMEPVVNFEHLPLPNDHTLNTEHTPKVNQPRGKASTSATEMAANSFRPRVQKRPDMSVQDISMKDAVEIQNMQMFHPTDRPESFIQHQNQAVAKSATTFEEKVQPFNNDMQQFQRTSQSQRANEEYANFQGVQFQVQEPQVRGSQPNLQTINNFGQGRVSSSTAAGVDRAISHVGSAISHVGSNTQIELVDPSTPLHQSFSNGNFNF